MARRLDLHKLISFIVIFFGASLIGLAVYSNVAFDMIDKNARNVLYLSGGVVILLPIAHKFFTQEI